MAQSIYLRGFSARGSDVSASPQHSAVVRITHWVNSATFLGLLVSGIAILISHPFLYWGETGGLGAPSLVDLPLPFILADQNGWARHLHFLSAWICVFNGLLYVLSGLLTQHFRQKLFPARADLNWESFSQVVSAELRLKRPVLKEPRTYNVVQRLTYLGVVFVLTPLVIWTGLAMSPAITSVLPGLVTSLGGAAIRAYDPLLRRRRSGPLCSWPHRNGHSRRFRQPGAGNDYGTR